MRAIAVPAVPASPVVTEVPAPAPEAGELLVKVAASSVNGFDVATAAGYLQGMMEHRFPLVLGKDFAGTVVATGDGVDGFAAGDAVFGVVMKPFLGTGSLAEYVTVPAAGNVARIPAGLSLPAAGALPLAGAAALDSLAAVDVKEGETLLVSGATGGVGAIAAQYAARSGATIIATARPGAESEFLAGLAGAGLHLVDHTGDLDSQVRAVAPGGVDAVLHLAGDGAQLTALLRPGGRIASTVGFVPDDVAGRDVSAHAVMTDANAATLDRLAADAISGSIRVPVTTTYALDEAPEAFAAFGAGTLGKLAVTVS